MVFLGGGAYVSLPDAAIWWCLRTGGGGVLTSFVYNVNSQIGTNSVSIRGVPIWEFFRLPAHFHTGSPHMEMGRVVLMHP